MNQPSKPIRELSNLRMCRCAGVYKSHHYDCRARIQFDSIELRLEAITKTNKENGDYAEELATKLDKVRDICHETADDFAPDSMPYDVADVVGRIKQILENDNEQRRT